MKHYAGLDLSMETTQVCVVDETGRKIYGERRKGEPEALDKALSIVGRTPVSA